LSLLLILRFVGVVVGDGGGGGEDASNNLFVVNTVWPDPVIAGLLNRIGLVIGGVLVSVEGSSPPSSLILNTKESSSSNMLVRTPPPPPDVDMGIVDVDAEFEAPEVDDVPAIADPDAAGVDCS
jgi:hypothetical protein